VPRGDPREPAVRHHPRGRPRAATPALPAARAGDPLDKILTAPSPWIRNEAELERLARRLRGTSEIALDTEGDSLHHYPERLALVQIADRSGEAWLVDPLAIPDLAPLAPVLAGKEPLVVLHAGDNDLVHLKRRHGLAFGAVFDTSIAARFLGGRALGLDVLLRGYLGVELPPSRQKDDWSVRPLTEAQERYATADVLHLLALKDRLVDELERAGRRAWVEEECAALAAEPAPERTPDPEAWARLKGARELSPRGLAILEALHGMRERLALAADRPPFKILPDATLVALAQAPPDASTLATVPGCTPRVIARWGEVVLESIARALALPPDELPVLTRPPRPPAVPGAVRRRIEALRAWRAETSPRFDLEPGVLLPNRLIGPIAQTAPRDHAELARVEGVRQWRVDVLGDGILDAVRRAGTRLS
jgi:ribonuclease D